MVKNDYLRDLTLLERDLSSILKAIQKTPILPLKDAKDPIKAAKYYLAITGEDTQMAGGLLANHFAHPIAEKWYDEEIEFMLDNQKTQMLRQTELSHDAALRALEAFQRSPTRRKSIEQKLQYELDISRKIALIESKNAQIARQNAPHPTIRPYLESLVGDKLTDLGPTAPGFMEGIIVDRAKITPTEFFEVVDWDEPIELGTIVEGIKEVFRGEKYRATDIQIKDAPFKSGINNTSVKIGFMNFTKGTSLINIMYGSDGFNVKSEKVKFHIRPVPDPIKGPSIRSYPLFTL